MQTEALPINATTVIDTAVEASQQDAPDAAHMSKNARKRALKQVQWKQRRVERRAKIKAKEKARRQLLKSQTSDKDVATAIVSSCVLKQKMASSSCRIHVVIDMQFTGRMTERENMKCQSQLVRSYSVNRRLDHPVQFHISSVGAIMQDLEARQTSSWDVNFHVADYHALFGPHGRPHPPEPPYELHSDADSMRRVTRICYLTADSDNVLDGPLSEDTAYIIGGIVDHNRLKGLTHQTVVERVERGLQLSDVVETHARLPIDECGARLCQSHVLSFTHVFEMLARMAQNNVISDNRDSRQQWREVINGVLPKRKMTSD